MSEQTPIENVPGEIVAWYAHEYLAVARDTTGADLLIKVPRQAGSPDTLPLGLHGRAVFLDLSGDGKTVLAQEKDSTGVFHLQAASFPALKWDELFPVSDPDPHVTWFADGRSFLYQDILDDSIGTPSVFQFTLHEKLPHLYMVGCQRPLLAPTGDAVVCVGADTLNPGSMRDLEMRQPVGMEDFKDGEFRWVAPLRTWIPTRGGWSPDGVRVALVGSGTDSAGRPERRVYLHSRVTRDNEIVSLAQDQGRAGKEHEVDAAVWSPDGAWIAVGMLPSRGGGVQGQGGVWLITPAGSQTYLVTPKTGTWTGVPFWTGERQFLINDGQSVSGRGPYKYWLVDIVDE